MATGDGFRPETGGGKVEDVAQLKTRLAELDAEFKDLEPQIKFLLQSEQVAGPQEAYASLNDRFSRVVGERNRIRYQLEKLEK